MKKFLTALLIGLSLTALSLDASAARLGGGSSFGRSMSIPKASPSSPFKAPSAAQAPRQNPAAGAAAAGAAAKSQMSMGKRLLIGAAAALGFMALANMLGLGEGFAQMLMFLTIALLAVLAFRMLTARKASQASGAGQAPLSERPAEAPREESAQPSMMNSAAAAYPNVRPGSAMDQFTNAAPQALDSSFEVPAEFDKEGFLNMSTAYFKMLQKAWDSGDMDSLANYCTDEFFIELTHKRKEIKGANLTEVVSLKAELAGFETTPTEYVASVLFTGVLKENGEAADLREIWNLVKAKEGKSGWLLAGIEQA